MNLNIMKEETLQGLLEQSKKIKIYTEFIAKSVVPNTWNEAQALVKNGLGSKIFPTATQLTMTDTSGTEWDLDVLGNDEDNAVASISHVLSLQFHSIFSLEDIAFDPGQFLFAVTAESLASLGIEGTALPAGTYNVTLDHGQDNNGTEENGTYQFTTTKPVPIGGGIKHSTIGTYHSVYSYGRARWIHYPRASCIKSTRSSGRYCARSGRATPSLSRTATATRTWRTTSSWRPCST